MSTKSTYGLISTPIFVVVSRWAALDSPSKVNICSLTTDLICQSQPGQIRYHVSNASSCHGGDPQGHANGYVNVLTLSNIKQLTIL